MYADPSRIHPINHEGKYYKVPGFHLCEPSPQRTPLLYQAGASPRGTAVATKHAEYTFVSGPSKKVVKKYADDLRAAVRAAGRDGDALKIYAQALIITAPTAAEAYAKLEEYKRHIDIEAALALLSGWTGVDFSRFVPELQRRGRYRTEYAPGPLRETYFSAPSDRDSIPTRCGAMPSVLAPSNATD